MPKGIGGRSTATITSFLEGVIFPASRDELIDRAEYNNAPQEVIDALEQLEDQEYTSMADVVMDISQME